MAEHGFDLTDFGEDWPRFKALADMHYVGRANGGKAFEWATESGVTVITQNNPETGEYGPGRDMRDDEAGFASYIGLTGPDGAVSELAKLIRQYADYIKGETPGRRAYI